MEAESTTGLPQASMTQRLLSAIVPVLFIAIAYIDPGKWASAVEGGARFGYDLIILMLIFNFAAILCQYLSASVAVVTGRDLAQICSEEYDMVTCIFLGAQAELSMIALDLSMILGTAHGLNLLFGVDLFACVLLTSIDAFLFPLVSSLLVKSKAKFICVCLASFVLLSYLLGVLGSQPEIPLSVGWTTLSKLSGESAFALMSLLGSSMMPHNFYLHSAIVQQEKGRSSVSKGTLCNDHFFAILCIFSGIFLVNYVLMNSAANVFYSTGLVLLTFQDALALMDQVFKSLVAPFALILVLLLSNHTTALTWRLGGQVILKNFFKLDIPGWLHHSTIRLIAIIPALRCVWTSGAEGTYQLLIFTQIMVALLLPSSVIPLFRVSVSRSVMGVHKISQFVEFLVLITFIGMLGLEIIFVIEMVFGNSDWASNLRWNMGSSSVPVFYVVLLITATVSLCLMLWLAATPLKSASSRSDTPAWNWDLQAPVPESFAERDRELNETRYRDNDYDSKDTQESTLKFENPLEKNPDLSALTPDFRVPEAIMDSDSGPHLTTIEENFSDLTFSSPSESQSEETATTVEMIPGSASVFPCEVSHEESISREAPMNEQVELVEKKLRVEGDLQVEKESVGDTWGDHDTSSKVGPVTSPLLTSEGPGSFRSLSGKGDDIGSGAGSLSRLVGLGRAARRQLAANLDEYWGQLFDFHGQPTQDAKIKKLDELLGIDSKVGPKPAPATLKADISGKEFSGYLPSNTLINSSLYESPRQQRMQSPVESPYGAQRGPTSMLSTRVQLLDAYAQNSMRNALDCSERRYSSLRIPPSSGGMRLPQPSTGYDDQPATIHGYQIKSLINQMNKERGSNYFNNQIEPLAAPKSPSLVSTNYKAPLTYSSTQKPQNGLTPAKPPGFPDPIVSRNNSFQPERTSYDRYSGAPTENMTSQVNEKKFHSMPDISLLLPRRDSPLNNSAKYGTLGRKMIDQSLYSGTSYRAGTPFSVDSVHYRPNQELTNSLWSRQPFEQFGVAGNAGTAVTEGLGSRQHSVAVDFEAKLLQSLRQCIMKLLKLEGSDWLFKQNGGLDEDLIDCVAARERFLFEAENKEMNRAVQMGESQFSVTSVPNCGEGCIWRVDLIISFGVWCIRRVLELSLMESRPELWGKYTYVLNRLQGVIDPAFSKPRPPMNHCFCLQLPTSHQQQRSPPRISNGSLPPPAKQGRGKSTTASSLLEIVKDVEIAISCRKGRTGTAAGDVAFPKGKENLASVLKRYKRRLSNKPAGNPESLPGSRNPPSSTLYS